MKAKTRDFEIDFFEGVLSKKPDYVDALIPLAEAYTRKGLYEKGLEIDLRLAKLRKRDPVVRYNLACSYAMVGKKEDALKTLGRALELGYSDYDHMLKDSDLRSLRGDPQFEKLLKSWMDKV